MRTSHLSKFLKISFACLLLGLISSTNVSAANSNCPAEVKLASGQTERGVYALNSQTNCNEFILNTSGFQNEIENISFQAHDFSQNFAYDVFYWDGSNYKALYYDKSVDSNTSDACKSFDGVAQPKFDATSCFKAVVLGIDHKTDRIKIVIKAETGKSVAANEYAYFADIRVNSTESTQAGGENYKRIRYDYVCSNYRFADLDAVFTGEVTNVTAMPDGDEDYLDLKVRYRFEVEKVLKGAVNENERLVLIGDESINKMVDDKYYIVYAQQLRDDKFKPLCIKQLYSPDDIPEQYEEPFDDTDNADKFEQYINALYLNGIINGYGDSGLFYPNECVKRSHLAKFLVNTFQFPINTSGVYFPDVVDTSSDLDLSIMTLYKAGVIKGYSNGYYMPDECVSREQAAAFIIRALQYAYPDIQLNGNQNFPDVNSSSFAQYIAYLSNLQVNGTNIVNGNSNGLFDPNRPLTRAEMAKIMYLVWTFKNQYRDVKAICFRNGGSWIEGAKECEGITRELCVQTQGSHSCQSRDRIRLFSEEEAEISVQSACGETEVSVCGYNTGGGVVSDEEAKCKNNGGNWLADSKQCNNVNQNTCNLLGGKYDECGSACGRYNTGVCTKQCVQACYFDNAVMPTTCKSWYDGCNYCARDAKGQVSCTLKYCAQNEAPKCLD